MQILPLYISLLLFWTKKESVDFIWRYGKWEFLVRNDEYFLVDISTFKECRVQTQRLSLCTDSQCLYTKVETIAFTLATIPLWSSYDQLNCVWMCSLIFSINTICGPRLEYTLYLINISILSHVSMGVSILVQPLPSPTVKLINLDTLCNSN